MGWRVRRVLDYLQAVPKVREAIDYIKLRNDIQDSNPTDLFSKQIIERHPQMLKIFRDSFFDLIENAVWIKKPNTHTPKRANNTNHIKERSKPSKIPENKTRKFNKTARKSKVFDHLKKKPLHEANENGLEERKTVKKPMKATLSKKGSGKSGLDVCTPIPEAVPQKRANRVSEREQAKNVREKREGVDRNGAGSRLSFQAKQNTKKAVCHTPSNRTSLLGLARTKSSKENGQLAFNKTR